MHGPVGLGWDDRFLLHQVPGHPERPDRIRAMQARLEETGLAARMTPYPGSVVDEALLLEVHDRAQVQRVDALGAAGGGWLDPDTYVVPVSPGVAREAAGLTVAMARAILAGEIWRGLALVRPPGHHATHQQSMGFCLFNNAALAAAAALDQGAGRVAIVDIDVHHGNGTEAIFREDPRVLYVSTHQYPFYPGTGDWRDAGAGAGQGTTINLPLPVGAGDAAFVQCLDQVIGPALERFAPALVLVSAGFDAYWQDPLAQLRVTPAGYRAMLRGILAASSRASAGRCLIVLEGGYHLGGIARCCEAVTRELLDDPEPVPDVAPAPPSGDPPIGQMLRNVRALHGL